MFLENHKRSGWIEVICGSMFSGKTEELIRRLKRAKFANQRVEIFKPQLDTRYSTQEVVSHDSNSILSTPVDSAESILLLANNVEVVGIDEAQFFDMNLIRVCQMLADNGIRVIVAGLDMDYLGNPFGPMPALLSVAAGLLSVPVVSLGADVPQPAKADTANSRTSRQAPRTGMATATGTTRMDRNNSKRHDGSPGAAMIPAWSA